MEGTSLPIGERYPYCLNGSYRFTQSSVIHRLNEGKIGDTFYIHNIVETLAYEVDQIVVAEPTQFEELLVKPGQDYATLLTCTPYMVNTHRLLVRGHRIPYVAEEHLKASENAEKRILIRYLLYALGMFVGILLIFLLTKGGKIKRK